MDTPSSWNGLVTVAIDCRCGASLRQTDLAHRCMMAEGEFRDQHRGALCFAATEAEREALRKLSGAGRQPGKEQP